MSCLYNIVRKNKKASFYIALFVVLFTISISVISLCNMYPRNVNLNIDYLGVIVGVLGILFCVLIGWNIFSVVNINNMAEDIVREREIIQSERANLTNEIRTTLTEEYSLMATSYENEIKKGKIEYAGHFIFFAVLLLLQLDKSNDVEQMNNICDKILNYQNSYNSITLSAETKNMICRNISLISSNAEKLKKVRDLVYSLPINHNKQ